MGTIKTKKISKDLAQKAMPGVKLSRSSLDDSVGEFFNINLEKLVPYRNQARTTFDQNELNALAQTIKEHGVRQPLTVIKVDEHENYEVVSGERRLRAAAIAGLEKVPCIILRDKLFADEIAIIENIQRSDLHPVELSDAFKKLLDKGMKQKEIAEKLSLSKTFVSEILKIQELSNETKQTLLDNNITSRDHLRKIIKDEDQISKIKEQQRPDFESIKRSKSIIRVGLIDGEYKIQKGGIRNLSDEQKKKLKVELSFIIKNYL